MHEKIPDQAALATLPVGTVLRFRRGLLQVAHPTRGRPCVAYGGQVHEARYVIAPEDYPLEVYYTPSLPPQTALSERLRKSIEKRTRLKRVHRRTTDRAVMALRDALMHPVSDGADQHIRTAIEILEG